MHQRTMSINRRITLQSSKRFHYDSFVPRSRQSVDYHKSHGHYFALCRGVGLKRFIAENLAGVDWFVVCQNINFWPLRFVDRCREREYMQQRLRKFLWASRLLATLFPFLSVPLLVHFVYFWPELTKSPGSLNLRVVVITSMSFTSLTIAGYSAPALGFVLLAIDETALESNNTILCIFP
eukprot:Gregarina_sp_Poly_1__1798@NODE_1467_length_4065_cov_76_270635_g971_i0_p2_GENE_NODE_1467_length_4065_cov_76_270635_g971_i0NODE_1467_length_4065_cov_76_270635_g971_i0_p2_ORF_typecomplete_len180_score8_40_NODE_1467_length_4065_cov_76_270635_g971_i012901829